MKIISPVEFIQTQKSSESKTNTSDHIIKNSDGSMVLNFDIGTSSNDTTYFMPTVTDDKPKRKYTKKQNTDSSDVVTETSDRPLGIMESKEPIENKYKETNAILKSAIAQIETTMGELNSDIQDIRRSKTLRNKYSYLAEMQSSLGSLLGQKIAVARELNNTIKTCNDFEMKRYKEIRTADANAGDDDARVMQMYQAFVNTPVSNPFPNVSTSAINGSAITAGVIGDESGFNSYMQNLTPQQNLMRLESNPNIKEVVVYNQETGARYFEYRDLSTGQPVPNTEPHDAMFLEDVTIDLKNKIARNINLGETYPLIVVGNNVLNEY